MEHATVVVCASSSNARMRRSNAGIATAGSNFVTYSLTNCAVVPCNRGVSCRNDRSDCHKRKNLHFIIPQKQFRLIEGHEAQRWYTWGTHTALRPFCETWFVKFKRGLDAQETQCFELLFLVHAADWSCVALWW